MLTAASRALAQLFDRATFGVLAASVLGSAAILALLWFGVGEALLHVHLFETSWLDQLTRAAIGLGAVLATLMLFNIVAVLIASLFVETIARAVERRWYPGLPAPRSQPLGEAIAMALGFAGASLLWNVVALPFYLIIPGGNLAIFLVLNGYLLGREYFELVAQRRFDRRSVRALRRSHPFRLLVAGALIAALSFVPLANLVTPIVATAFMMHILYALPGLAGGGMREGLPSPSFR